MKLLVAYLVWDDSVFISAKYVDSFSNYKKTKLGIQFWTIFSETNMKIIATGNLHTDYNGISEGLLLPYALPACLFNFCFMSWPWSLIDMLVYEVCI